MTAPGSVSPAVPRGLTLTQAAYWQWSPQAPSSVPSSGAAAAHTAECLRLRGVDTVAFLAALGRVWEALPQLRARIAAAPDGQPRQWLGAQPVSLPERRSAMTAAEIQAWHEQPYDLAAGQLTRQLYWEGASVPGLEAPALGASSQSESGRALHYLLGVHHLALDGYGYALFWQRLAAEYRALTVGEPRPVVPPPVQEVLAEEAAYLASAAPVQDRKVLQALYQGRRSEPAPLLERGLAWGHRAEVTVLAQVRQGLDTLAQTAGLNWADLILAFTAHDWHLATGEREPLTGLAMMNRLGTAAARVPLMNMNMLPVPTPAPASLNPADLLQSASQIRAGLRRLQPHSRFRYEALWHSLGQRRLFGPEVNIIPFTLPLNFGSGVQAQARSLISGPTEDLSWTVSAAAGQTLKVVLEGHPAIYTPAELQHRVQRLGEQLDAAAAGWGVK